jgi:hypothetical protein
VLVLCSKLQRCGFPELVDARPFALIPLSA